MSDYNQNNKQIRLTKKGNCHRRSDDFFVLFCDILIIFFVFLYATKSPFLSNELRSSSKIINRNEKKGIKLKMKSTNKTKNKLTSLMKPIDTARKRIIS